jgi:hypothetical protein
VPRQPARIAGRMRFHVVVLKKKEEHEALAVAARAAEPGLPSSRVHRAAGADNRGSATKPSHHRAIGARQSCTSFHGTALALAKRYPR